MSLRRGAGRLAAALLWLARSVGLVLKPVARIGPTREGRSTWRRYLRLMRYAAPHWTGWVFILVVTLLSAGFGLLQPWPMKVLVDNVLGGKVASGPVGRLLSVLPGASTQHGLLGWVALAGLLVFAINSVLDVVLTWSWIKVGQRMVYDLAADLFAVIQRRSLLFHNRSPVGDSLSRITGDSWSAHTVVDTLLVAPGHALIVSVGMIVVMARMSPALTLMSLAIVPVMAFASIPLGRPVKRVARVGREADSRLQSHIQQTLRGIHVVQAFGREEKEVRRFRELTREVIRAQRRSAWFGNMYGFGSGLITTLGTGAILLFGAHQVMAGTLSIGGLLVFLSYQGSLQAQLKVFSGTYSALQSAGAQIDRVMEVMEEGTEVEEKAGAKVLEGVKGRVVLEDVTFGYEERPILRGVSLEARPGEMVAIVGATGAGKSTLVSLVPRFFDPWKGRVLVDDEDVREVSLRSLREHVSIVLQEPFLFPVSIAENIAYGKPEAGRGEIEAAARAANAHEFIERLSDGYETVIGERGATLSGGERQRISIARALLKDAPVLILDEPTSALDAETESLLLEALERLMEGRTTLIIAHRLSTIRKADKIVVLEHGRIAETGTHQELVKSGGIYARLYRFQTRGDNARREEIRVS